MAVQEFTTEELESEEWRFVPGFDRRYAVSNLGRVRTECNRRRTNPSGIIKPRLNQRGPYYIVNLKMGGGHRDRPNRKTYTVHRLVALAFIGPRPSGYQINHIDAVKMNNRLANLEYVTPAENTHHAMKLGLMPTQRDGPVGHAKPKITSEQAMIIRDLATKGHSFMSIAREYPVCTDRTVARVVRRDGPYAHI